VTVNPSLAIQTLPLAGTQSLRPFRVFREAATPNSSLYLYTHCLDLTDWRSISTQMKCFAWVRRCQIYSLTNRRLLYPPAYVDVTCSCPFRQQLMSNTPGIVKGRAANSSA
jgi:hypothetical protein